MRAILLAACALHLAAAPAGAQDTLQLADLQRAAVELDPRASQLLLQTRAHELKMESLRAERLPRLRVQGEATRQSDVPTLPLELPGVEIPTAPRTRYQASISADRTLHDGGSLRLREAAETARHAEAEAELLARLHPLRMEVTEAFFGALVLQVREAEARLLITDLDGRLAQVRARYRAGAALPGDTAVLRAERLRASQSLDELAAGRRTAAAVLADLTGVRMTDGDGLAVPALAGAVEQVESAGGAGAVRKRPEFERFARQRERIEREMEVVTASARPRVALFGQGGIGRPGPFQIFSDELNEFWLAGVRLDWQPWTWGETGRQREQLRVQAEIVETEAAALAARLQREVRDELEEMRRLERALETDDTIIALREQVERQAARQFEERAITASQYVTIRTDLHESRVARELHRVELERARARYLTTLGVALEPDGDR